jgi:uncharacterized membrane protein YfcA
MTLPLIIALISTSLVGLSLGALGSGGSILVVPILIYIAGMPLREAIAMSLAIVCGTSLVGAVAHYRRGAIESRVVAVFAMTGMVGAFIGSAGAHMLPRTTMMLSLSGVMAAAGIRMWNSASVIRPRSFSLARCLAAGFVVGMLSGFLGVGGGFLIVPALALFAGLSARASTASSLAIITLNSASGVVGQLRFVSLETTLLAGFISFAVAGLIAGIYLSDRLSESGIRRTFGAFVLTLAIGIAAAESFKAFQLR